MMRRREFISLLGGAAAMWPSTARARPGERMRRICVLMAYAKTDPEIQARIAAFRQELGRLGWIEGKNVRIDDRWADIATGHERMTNYTTELVSLKPDVILVNGPGSVTSVLRESRTIPIVFAGISDPVALEFVESLARPGGSVTGFTIFDGSVVGKLFEALKEIAPAIARIALIFNPENASAAGHFRALEVAATSLDVEPIAVPVRNRDDIERAIEIFAQKPNGGLVFSPDAITFTHRELIIASAERHRLPAVYPERAYVTAGGLMSYGPDRLDLYRRAASYVDRILKGTKPADLPVQQPTRFQFVLNLKAAKALGIDVPAMVLVRADEVVE